MQHFSHTTPHQQLFTSNSLPTAHRNISRRTTDAAHHTQESASILPTPCRIFTVTEAGVCRMHVQTPCRIRVYILKNTTAVVLFFRIGQGVSGPVCHKIDHDLPGVCVIRSSTRTSTRWNYTKGTTCMNDRRYDQVVQSTP